jgi:hypothetical protein
MSWVKVRVNFQALSHRPLAAKNLLQFQVKQGKNRCGESGPGRDFSSSTSVFPVRVIQPVALIPFHLGVALSRGTNDRTLLDISKGKLFQKLGIVGYNLTTGFIKRQSVFVRSTVHRGHKYLLQLTGCTAWSKIKTRFEILFLTAMLVPIQDCCAVTSCLLVKICRVLEEASLLHLSD